jgi:hypothetical protein
MNAELEAIMKRRRQLYSPARRPSSRTTSSEQEQDNDDDDEAAASSRRRRRVGDDDDDGPPLLPPGDMTTMMPPPPPPPPPPPRTPNSSTRPDTKKSPVPTPPPPPPPPPKASPAAAAAATSTTGASEQQQQQQHARQQTRAKQTLEDLRGIISSDDEEEGGLSSKPTFSSEDVFEDIDDSSSSSSQDEILAARTSLSNTTEHNHSATEARQEVVLEQQAPQQQSPPIATTSATSSSSLVFQGDLPEKQVGETHPNTTTTSFIGDEQVQEEVKDEEEAAYEPPPTNLIIAADLKPLSPPPAPWKEPSSSVTSSKDTIGEYYYSPRKDPPKRPKPTVVLQETDYFRGEPFLCPPVVNPLTNNVIACRRDNTTTTGNSVLVQEFDMRRSVITLSTNLLSLQVKHKVSASLNQSAAPYHVSSVLCCAAGLHRTDNNHTRVRVGVLVEFDTLLAKQTTLLIYQWGYGSNHSAVHLQSVLSPPQSSSFTYSADSLQLADGLVFLSGMAKAKGPCVFCVKPHIKDVWQVNLLNSESTATQVSTMRVTTDYHRKHKYMAIALTDGSVGVWTYQSAVERKAEQSKKTLLPLCRLECMEAIEKAAVIGGEEQVAEVDTDQDDYCTGLEWIRSSDSSGLLLLGAAFSHGMAVFLVSLPLMSMSKTPVSDPKLLQSLPAPTASTHLSNTVVLHPMTAARWSETVTSASLSWIHFGPHVPYGLAFLLEDEGSAVSLIVGTLGVPSYSSENDDKETVSFRMLCKQEIADVGERSPCRGIIASPDSLMASCYDYNALRAFRLSLSTGDAYFTSMKHLVASASPGLDSVGYVWLPDAASDRDGILQVASVTQCKRTGAPADLISPVDGAQLYAYSTPRIRHWLVRSFVGDSRDAQRPSAVDQSQDDFDGNVTGGSYSKVVCDLQIEAGRVPCRIVRCKGSELCAVLFRRTLDVEDGPLTEPDLIALVDTDAGEIVEILDGRDIVILPKTERSDERLLILSPDGGTLFMVVRTKGNSEWTKGSLYRPVVGDGDEAIECHRLHLFSTSDSKMRLVVYGTSVRDGLACLVMGSPVPTTGEELNTRAIPDVKKDPTFWLSPGEELSCFHELPRYQHGNRCIAISTNRRVLLLSDKLVPLAKYEGKVSSDSLASIGSHGIAFFSEDYKLRYLCCLEQNLACGTIASLTLPLGGQMSYHLLALRPERFVYTAIQNKSRVIELGQNINSLTVNNAITRPAMLLEPMIANALCEADQPSESTNLLRAVIEKFGRKSAAFPHGDDEGIGTGGTGLTPRAFEMLSLHGLKHPASWLLTGTTDFQRSSNTTVLPPWIPAQSKSIGAMNADARLHVVANGDAYLCDYIRSPDQNMASTLPRPTDPSTRLCHEWAKQAMEEGDIAGALKLLDFSGSESSDGELLNIILSLQLGSSADITKVLDVLSGRDDNTARSGIPSSSTSSLAALAKHLRSGHGEKVSDDFARQWLSQLAPSLRRNRNATRARHRLIGESAMEDASWGTKQKISRDRHWKTPCNESRHIWNEGPGRDKENLLLLDSIDDWIGRVKPGIIGKEGASAALERGEKTLADILGRANDYEQDSFGDQSDEGSSSSKGGWVEGVGEGRTDDDNLSGYYRFSEGAGKFLWFALPSTNAKTLQTLPVPLPSADEDSNWKTEGIGDLSRYQNRAIIVGAEGSISLEPSSSSVDEGDPGKVKLLYDMVVSNVEDAPFGLVLEIERGSSLDVGILHSQARDNRRRSTLEFWFNLPRSEDVKQEIVLARRSSASGDEHSKLCNASERDSFLWELVALPTGELEFRTNRGSSMLSTSDSNPEFDEKEAMDDFGDVQDDGEGTPGLVSWQRPEGSGGWNHVCVVFSSREHSKPTECTVKLYMKGARVAASVVSIAPPYLSDSQLSSTSAIDEAMKRTALVFGLNAPKSYRMTELRVWSCERSEGDLRMMMYEYLHAAETKRKFKIKIRNKQAEPASEGTRLLAPPKEGRDRPEKGAKGLLLPPPRQASSEDISPRPPLKNSPAFQFDAAFETQPQPQQHTAKDAPSEPKRPKMSPRASKRQLETGDRPLSSSMPLSRQVRSSAAAALVRGPPATRHFGGNRGGLSDDSRRDFVESRRFGVGAIAICGAEKTVVYSCDQDPPGKTYPIGASGAIISDKMDNQGSEYLCCFLAKDKRMVSLIDCMSLSTTQAKLTFFTLNKRSRQVVFELSSKTVVVELQMTTKLNFWRFLPPQAHGHTLVFMLITPIGGFHWLPLDESPRPRQVWKRGPELQGKKIVMYEEGGSNGLLGADARATVALLLVSSASSSALEAWVMQIGGESQTVCVSGHVLGAALSRLFNVGYDAFLPFIVTANTLNESDVMVEIGPLVEDPSSGNLVVSEWISRAVLDQQRVANVDFAPPTLAMGTLPEVLCCCHENIIVVCLRRKGLVAAYNSELSLSRQEHVGSYIVDAALRSGDEGIVEVILLLSDNDNPRDGRIVSFEVEPSVRVAV